LAPDYLIIMLFTLPPPPPPQCNLKTVCFWYCRKLLRPIHYDFWLQLVDVNEDRVQQSAVLRQALAAWPQHVDFWELHIHLATLPPPAPEPPSGQKEQLPSGGAELCGEALRSALDRVTGKDDRLKLWQCYLQVLGSEY
jgi:hypothetical protein